MLLTVFCLRRDRSELTFSLQVDADFELQNFRALCELESGIPASESQIVYAERPLTDNHRSLASYGLKDGDVVILQQVENANMQPPAQFPGLPRIDFSSIAVPGISAQVPEPQPPQPVPHSQPSPSDLSSSPQGLDNPALLRDMLLANPHELSLLKERNPPLAEALLSGDLEKFTRVLVEQQQDRARRERERIRLFSADPFDLEAQAKIEEDIRQQNIEENMTIAMEEAPESFGQVVMLYINCKVNGHPVKAFVDSGAQMTIMSQACAERCNIMRLVDRRWAGIAKGVGTQKIIGRVHLAQVQIEGDFLPCSFSILEEQPMDMLLGLDMLKRHQCSIDLKKNVLVIGTTGSQTTFLPEGELPDCARLAYGAGREDVQPEDIADQELAEAIQKSVEESDNIYKESTSLEMPSSPMSDGVKRPVRFPEISPKTSNPARRLLDRSISAPPVCSRKCSLAETVNLRAAKSLELLPNCPVTLEREESRWLSLDLSTDNTSSAIGDASLCEKEHPSPTIPSQNILEEPGACGSVKKSYAKDSILNLESSAEVVGCIRTPNAGTTIRDLVLSLPSENLELNLLSDLHLDLKAHKEHGKERSLHEQSESTAREHLRAGLVSPSPADGEHTFAMESRAEEGERGFSDGKATGLELMLHKCPASGTCMEVDGTEQSLIDDGGNLSSEQNGSPVLQNLECSAMEVESCNQLSSLSGDSISESDFMQPGRIVFESTDISATVSISASSSEGQLSNQAEEPSSISLTSALKELHRFLVVSCKGDLTVSWHEDDNRPAAALEEQMTKTDILNDECECTDPDSQEEECMNIEASPEMPLAVAGTENVSMQELLRVAVRSEQDILTQEHLDLNSSTILHPSAASSQPQPEQRPETLPLGLSSSQIPDHDVLGQNQSLSSCLALDEDASRGAGNFPPGIPGASNTCVPQSPDGRAEPWLPLATDSLEIDFAAPQPPVLPSVDTDRIVGAGFTLQEAGEALEHANGNVDLALLILLAKNIIVPT